MFCYSFQRKKKKIFCEKKYLLEAGWHKKFAVWFQGARPDHVRVESLSRCFLYFRELASFVRPGELVSFNPRHVTDSHPIGRRI